MYLSFFLSIHFFICLYINLKIFRLIMSYSSISSIFSNLKMYASIFWFHWRSCPRLRVSWFALDIYSLFPVWWVDTKAISARFFLTIKGLFASQFHHQIFLSVFKVFLYSIICRKWLYPLVIMLSNNFEIFYILKDIEINIDNRKYCSCAPLISFVYDTIFTFHI